MKNPLKSRIVSFAFAALLTTGSILLMSCGGGGGGGTTDANPDGLYEGTAMVNQTTDIQDLVGMLSGNHFMFVSAGQVLLYDGTITEINGHDYTATVSVYQHGALVTTATVSGRITTGSTINGTFTDTDTNITDGLGNGSFSLTYTLNNQASALSRIAKYWRGGDLYHYFNGASSEVYDTIISLDGAITKDFTGSTPVLAGCSIANGSTVTPVAGINVYSVSLSISGCTNEAVNGSYTGLASTRTNGDYTLCGFEGDNELIIGFTGGTNTAYSGSGVINCNPT